MNVVVDASVAVKWYVNEPFDKKAETLLAGNASLNAPELIVPEFGSIIWKKVRRGELTQSEGRHIVQAFSSQNILYTSHKTLIVPAYFGAEISGQTVYDWTYLALAVKLSCQLVTADEKFYKALETKNLVKHLKWIGDL